MASIKKHPDYQKEVQRLKEVKQKIIDFKEHIRQRQKVSSGEIKEAFVNLDYLDSSQSYITILVNARYLDRSRENLDKVLRTENKPYFSRIDFQDDREEKSTSYYIGKLSLFKENQEPLIIDWRTPIASVYYDSGLGPCQYEAEEGTVTGKLDLKRHYSIEEGELQDFFDVDITTNDELLQTSLRDSADSRLKDIVATIQAEQNQIIRAALEKPLIVQGVAGSGKTTIALHRIAYLVYTHEKSFSPDNFVIFAPNTLFLNYISDVLPELGVEQVRQTTFTDFCRDILNVKLKITEPEEKLTTLLENGKETSLHRELIQWAAAFKGSLVFKQTIDRYLAQLAQEMTPREDVQLEGHEVMNKEEVEKAFTTEYSYLPLNRRLEQLKKKINSRVKVKKNKLLEDITADYQARMDRVRAKMVQEAARKKAVSLMEERDEMIDRIKKSAGKLAGSYLKPFQKRGALSCYQEILNSPESLLAYLPPGLVLPEQAGYIVQAARARFKAKELEPEDLAPLLYLQFKLEGTGKEIRSQNVFIDEAQDFSLFQLTVLKQVLGTEHFTLLGDLAQGIHAYRGIQRWEEVVEHVFSGNATCLSLQRSYRTTVEIMTLANQVLREGEGTDGIALAEPVVRHGHEPEICVYTKKDQLAAGAARTIKQMRQEGHNSIAIVGKTWSECMEIKKLLEKKGLSRIPLLAGHEDAYQAGAVIIPSYATKGLEFDAVLLINLENTYGTGELDTRLLYVALTRAMHRLFIYEMKNHEQDSHIVRLFSKMSKEEQTASGRKVYG